MRITAEKVAEKQEEKNSREKNGGNPVSHFHMGVRYNAKKAINSYSFKTLSNFALEGARYTPSLRLYSVPTLPELTSIYLQANLGLHPFVLFYFVLFCHHISYKESRFFFSEEHAKRYWCTFVMPPGFL